MTAATVCLKMILILNVARAIQLHNIEIESKMAANNQYEDCVKRLKESTSRLGSAPAKLMTVGQRAVVRLACSPCASPSARQPMSFWFYRLWNVEDFVDVPVADAGYAREGFVLGEEFTLIIMDVSKITHGGEYVCTNSHGQVLSTYYLDVVNVTRVEMTTGGMESDIKDVERIERERVEIVYEWTTWTACNRCNFGERRRYAQCVVRAIANGTEGAVDKQFAKLLKLFPQGVPCESSWIPEAVRARSEIARPTIVNTEFCIITCKPQAEERNITEVDSTGNLRIVEKVKRGFVSRDEDVPLKPPPVVRQVQQIIDGGPLTLYCGHGQGEVFWQKENIYLPSAILEKYSQSRIHYSPEGHMIFASTIDSDSGFYSCWRFDNVLLLSVRLLVEDARAEMATKTAILAGGAVVLLVFVLIIVYSFTRSRPVTK